MAIVRTIEWKLICSSEDADEIIRRAFVRLDMNPEGPPRSIKGLSKRAIRKNRRSAEVSVFLHDAPGGCAAVCRVDMLGNKHFEILNEIAEAVGDTVFDDRGVTEAIDRLDGFSQMFGRREIRHLRNLIHATERVVELGQGRFDERQGLVVLTNERLFFFEKSLGLETIEEFNLGSISSVDIGKRMGGETLKIYTSAKSAEIYQMMHGQADALSRALRTLKSTGAAVQATPSTSNHHESIALLEQLAVLRDKGILSTEEFEAKKAGIMRRM